MPIGTPRGGIRSLTGFTPRRIGSALRRLPGRLVTIWHADWQGPRYFSGALVVLAFTALITALFYLNHPQAETYPDTATYLAATANILQHGKFVDLIRTPGYPSFIAIVFLLAGNGNLQAVSIMQGALFVLAALEIYALLFAIVRRTWIACAVGLLCGCNVLVLSFAKPILSEGFSLWLTVSLALACVLFVRRLRAFDLWLVTLWLGVLVMTRSEWEFAPIPILGFLLVLAARHGRWRALLPHAGAAVLCLYLLIGGYIYANATINHYAGMTDVENVNLLGKVMQYHMQLEAPPQYSAQAQLVNQYVARGVTDPYAIVDNEPTLADNHFALAGAYSRAVILSHPTEFITDSIPVAEQSLTDPYYDRSPIAPDAFAAAPLLALHQLFLSTYSLYALAPLLSLIWLALVLWRKTARSGAVEGMAVVIVIAGYDLILTTGGGYGDYSRLHVAFSPFLLLLFATTPLLAIALLANRIRDAYASYAAGQRLVSAWPAPLSFARYLAGAVVSDAASYLRHLAWPRRPTTDPAKVALSRLRTLRPAATGQAGLRYVGVAPRPSGIARWWMRNWRRLRMPALAAGGVAVILGGTVGLLLLQGTPAPQSASAGVSVGSTSGGVSSGSVPTPTPSRYQHPGLAPSTADVHLGLVFDTQVSNPASLSHTVDLVWGSLRPQAWTGDVVISYNPFDRIGNDASFHPLYSLDWFLANHPTWVEYKCDRTTPAFFPGESNAPLDITNPDVLQFLWQQEYLPQINAGFGAIGFDNVAFYSVSQRCGHYDAQHQWVQQFTGQAEDPPYRLAVLAWAQTTYQMIHTAKPGISVAINFAYEFGNQDSSMQLLKYMDILVDERGFTNFGSSGANGLYMSNQHWADYVGALTSYEAQGGAVFVIDEEPTSTITPDQLQWALANYLMIQDHYTYLAVTGPQQYGFFIDHPEYHLKTGSSLGSIQVEQCAQWRDFTAAAAAVNPSSLSACTLSVPKGAFTDLTGAPIASLELPPHSGAVLLRVGG